MLQWLPPLETGDYGLSQTVLRCVEEAFKRNPEFVIILHLKEAEMIVREEVMRADHVTPSLVQVNVKNPNPQDAPVTNNVFYNKSFR